MCRLLVLDIEWISKHSCEFSVFMLYKVVSHTMSSIDSCYSIESLNLQVYMYVFQTNNKILILNNKILRTSL